MELHIDDSGERRPGAVLMLALEPPGNIARDLALFRRGLFARLGEGSALALPEIAPLALAPLSGRRAPRWPSASTLGSCWRGIEGVFSAGGLRLCDGSLFLVVEGPMETLSLRAAKALDEGRPPMEEHGAILEGLPRGGVGIFLCHPSDQGRALAEAQVLGPPRLDFGDCSLVLLGLSLGRTPFGALSWRELARARRRTGPRRRPDQLAKDSTATLLRPQSFALRSARSAASIKSSDPTKSG